jgi:hypothetical protein
MPPKRSRPERPLGAPQYKLGVMLQHNLHRNLDTTNDFQMSEGELMFSLNQMGITELSNADKFAKVQ